MDKNPNNPQRSIGASGKTIIVVIVLIMLVGAGFMISKNKKTISGKPESHPEQLAMSDPAPITPAEKTLASGVPDRTPIKSKTSATKPAKTERIAAKSQTDENEPLVIGITIGLMEMAFKTDGKSVSVTPEANKALTQVKKDGFVYIHLMEPFVKGYLQKFPVLPVQAVKLLVDRGFKVSININGSPFINGDTDSERKWVYRYFPGDDPIGKDDDGGLAEHKRRMTKFMDALLSEGLIPHMQFQFFDEPNSKRAFWGTFNQFEKLLAANLEIITKPKYGIANKDILGPAFTSKLVLYGDNNTDEHKPYWNFVKNYRQNPLVNKYPFSFNYFPVSGNIGKGENHRAADLKLTKELLEGAWITGMNVTAYMTVQNLHGKGASKGFRQMDTFKEKTEDIIQFAKAHNMAGIYIFSLKNRKAIPSEKGKVGTGLFNAEGCPRKEYKDLLNILKKPVNFVGCPEPDIVGD